MADRWRGRNRRGFCRASCREFGRDHARRRDGLPDRENQVVDLWATTAGSCVDPAAIDAGHLDGDANLLRRTAVASKAGTHHRDTETQRRGFKLSIWVGHVVPFPRTILKISKLKLRTVFSVPLRLCGGF